jgi:nucleotide-binding universal stress UspA family protein
MNPQHRPIKKVLLCTDGSVSAQCSYQYAAWLVQQTQAQLQVLHVTDTRHQAANQNLSGSIGMGASERLLDELVALDHQKAKLDHQRAQLILQQAQDALAKHGVQPDALLHRTGFLVDCVEQMEADVDLIILGKRGMTAEFAPDHLGSHLERIVRSSRKPCLVTPRAFQPVQRLVVAYDSSASNREMLKFLARTALFAQLEIHILSVLKSMNDGLIESQKHEIGQILTSSVDALIIRPTLHFLAGKPEQVIPQFITEHKGDVLLMGAYGHSRLRHLVIGSTTAQILRGSSIPTFVFR